MTSFWSAYITILSLLCLGWIIVLLYWVLRHQRPHIEPDGTTGHTHDGLQEYDKQIPKWWILAFILTFVFAVFYFVMYPGLGNWKGLATVDGKPWTSANEVNDDLDKNDRLFTENFQKNFGNKDIVALAADPKAIKSGGALFLQNCALCHGSNAKGGKGFPNLTDKDWLFGGDPATIQTTIANGRTGAMPAWKDIIGEDGVNATTEYVLSLNGKATGLDQTLVTKGQTVFASTCAACHGADAKGMQAMGSANLTDATWLYGSDRDTVRQTIANGRAGIMPAWSEKLGPERIKLLSAYVYSLSQ